MMRFLRWMLIGMTGTTAGCTLNEAANGGDVGLIFFGLAVAVAGIFVVALWNPNAGEGES